MNDKNFEKLSALKDEHLSQDERELLRGRITSFMTAHPISAAPSPYTSSFRKIRKPVAAASVLALFALSAGVSYASEAAVPGDLLYPIKVHVNEAVISTIARTPSAKASFAQKQIVRRAEETELLTRRDKLDDATKQALSVEIKASLKSFSDAKGELLRSGKVEEVAHQDKDISETFDRHTAALESLGVTKEGFERERVRGKRDEEDKDKDKREQRSVSSTTPTSTDQNNAAREIRFNRERERAEATSTQSTGTTTVKEIEKSRDSNEHEREGAIEQKESQSISDERVRAQEQQKEEAERQYRGDMDD